MKASNKPGLAIEVLKMVRSAKGRVRPGSDVFQPTCDLLFAILAQPQTLRAHACWAVSIYLDQAGLQVISYGLHDLR